MSNVDLRRVLVQNGVSVGPITARTRNAYETKCANLGITSSYSQSTGTSSQTRHSQSYSAPARQTQSYNQYSSAPVSQTQNYRSDYSTSGYSASRPSVSTSTSVQNMSNTDLRRTLVNRGVSVGPVTVKTRNAYEKKYLNLSVSSTVGQTSVYSPTTTSSKAGGHYSCASPKQTTVPPPKQRLTSSPTFTKKSVESMTNSELRRTLVDHSVSVGPITEKNRNAYEKKYLNLSVSSAAGQSSSRSPTATRKAADHYVSASPKQKQTLSTPKLPSSPPTRPKQPPPSPISYSKKSIESMTNSDLRRILVNHGVGVGPITEKTRKAYENKVVNLSVTSGRSGSPVQANNLESGAKPKLQPVKKQPTSFTKSVVDNMSSADLRRTLIGHGVGVGLITEKTRKAYENRVLNLDVTSSVQCGSQTSTTKTTNNGSEVKLQSLEKQPSPPSAYAQSVVENMSNSDLRRTLIDHGIRVGPITAKTRKAYENKYLNLGTFSRNIQATDRQAEHYERRNIPASPVFARKPKKIFWEYVVPFLNTVPQESSSNRVNDLTHPRRSALVKAENLVLKSPSGRDSNTPDNIQLISCDNNVLKIKCTSSPVLTKLNDLRKTKESFDVVLKIGEKEFLAHKTILSAFSPFFEAMISDRWQVAEACQSSIELKTVEAKIMESILDFAYSKSIEINDPDVPAMLEAACFLQVEQLVYACCEYLGNSLNAENCLSIDSLAILFSGAAFEDTLLKLHEKARNYAIANFSVVCQQADFVELESQDLIDIISNDSLSVDKEQVVFEAVLRWLHHNVKDRYLVLNQVLSYVRLVNLEIGAIFDRLEREGILAFCQPLMEKITKYHTEPYRRSDVLSSLRRHRRSSPDIEVLLVHDVCSESHVQTVGCFDQFGEKVSHLPVPAIVSRNNIFVASTQFSNTSNHEIKILARCSYDIWRYDFQRETWTQIAPLLKPRHSFGLCELDSCWYAFGGTTSGNAIIDSVEKYSQSTNSWTEMGPLPIPVSNPSVVCHNGNLFVIGGSKDGTVPSDQVNQFNPRENAWTTITTLPVPLKNPSACVLDGNIYIGSEEIGDQIFIYNVPLNEWKNCQRLPYPLLSGPITVNGDVYVLTKSASKSCWVVRYNPSSDSWKEFAIVNDFEPQILAGPLLMKRPQK